MSIVENEKDHEYHYGERSWDNIERFPQLRKCPIAVYNQYCWQSGCLKDLLDDDDLQRLRCVMNREASDSM